MPQTWGPPYLKGLVLSSMMDWIAAPKQRTMDEVMEAKVVSLREQMVSLSSVDAGEPGDMYMGPRGRMTMPRR